MSLYARIYSGGGNAARLRASKHYLQELNDEARLEVVVGHCAPRTSKWNKIEHRLFFFIGMNWKREPLVSVENVVNMIRAAKTSQGLRARPVSNILNSKCYFAASP